MFSEDNLLPISSLTHLSYCKRRFALVHIEQMWAENVFTAEGRNLHDRVHADEAESRGDVRIVRGLRLQCRRLGLVGQADVVEFHLLNDSENAEGVKLEGVSGLWQPFPVEYKRGKPKIEDCDRVQLCAQALCLEEMLKLPEGGIEYGALFYGRPRRRERVRFNATLRAKTTDLIAEMHRLHAEGRTPKAKYEKKCLSCSLYSQCMPKTTGIAKDVQGYIQRNLGL